MTRSLALLIAVAACGGGGSHPTTTDPDAPATPLDAPAAVDPAVGSYTGALLTDAGDQAILDLRIAPPSARTRPGPVLSTVSGTATFPATSFGTVTITGMYDPNTHALSATLTGTGFTISATFDGTTFVISPAPHVTISLVPGAASLVQAYCGTFQSTDQTTAGRWTLLTATSLGIAAGAFAATSGQTTAGGVLGGSVDGAHALTLTMTTTLGTGASGTAVGTADGTTASGSWTAFGKSGSFGGTLAACPVPNAAPPFEATHTIAAGASGYFLAVTANHTVVAWGDDTVGQLGNGQTNTSSPTPVAVTGLANIVAVAAGDSHALALASDGTVYGWGLNQTGELGGVASTPTPKQITAFAGHHIVAIAAGNQISLAIDATGAVLVFGVNDVGQLGSDTGGQSIAFPTVSSITAGGIVAASNLGAHSLVAIQPTPTTSMLVAMGDNSQGQLGDGTTTPRSTPTGVNTTAHTVLAVAAGYDHTAAILDGKLTIWGNVQALGQNATGHQATPLAIANSGFPRHVAAGQESTIYVDVGGTVWSLGADQQGSLGLGDLHANTFVATPLQLPGITNAVDVAAAYLRGAALTSTGDVYTWGAGIGTSPVLAATGIAVPE